MSEDPIEKGLKTKMINATYDYFQYIQKTWTEKFNAGVKDKVLDETSFLYKYFYTNEHKDRGTDELQNVERDPETKKYYRQLSLQVHPDKCKEEWATAIFALLNEYYIKNNHAKMQEMYTYYLENGTFINYISDMMTDVTKEKEISDWKRQMWYLWNTDKSFYGLFITPEELAERIKFASQFAYQPDLNNDEDKSDEDLFDATGKSVT